MNFNLRTCEDKICIPLTLQSYVLNSNYMYLIHPRMYRTETMIGKHLCWSSIRKYPQKEVSNCDTC